MITPQDGADLARAALALAASDAPTAFICPMRGAPGLVETMSAAGRTFPRDYSLAVIASEELELARLGPTQRELATIAIPTMEVSRRAAQMLFQRLSATSDPLPPPPAGGMKVPCRISEGESCGPCPRID
jgi:DNA-binding LacI/PurR family transcriptional regulator